MKASLVYKGANFASDAMENLNNTYLNGKNININQEEQSAQCNPSRSRSKKKYIKDRKDCK